MKCEHISELLPDLLQGNLNQEQGKQVEEHIAHCMECAEQVVIWKKLALLPAEQPSPEVRACFEAMLAAYQSGRADRTGVDLRGERRGSFWSGLHWFRSPVGALAWSVVLLAAGVYIGSQVKGTGSNGQAELSNMRQLVALAMMQQQSASGRLEGVSWTRREQQLDPQVLSALMHTLRYDPSVDVRLAALDALTRHASQPQVHKEVSDTLQEQQSPLVQVALIDQLVEWHDPEAAQRLHKLQQNPKLNPTVRQRAEWAVSKLGPSTN